MESQQVLENSDSEFITLYSDTELNAHPRLLSNECTDMIMNSENCQSVIAPFNDLLLEQTFIIETDEPLFVNDTQLVTFQHMDSEEQIDNIPAVSATDSEKPINENVNFAYDHFQDVYSSYNKTNSTGKTTNAIDNNPKERLDVFNDTEIDITRGNYSNSTAIKILNDVAKSPVNPNGHFVCDLCLSEFYNWKFYKRHKLEHLNDKPFKCSKCSKSFNYNNNYLLHIASHLNNNLRCPQCKKEFKRTASFKSHLQIHAVEEFITCNICHKTFDNQYRLDIHKENCMQENIIKSDDRNEATTAVCLKTCKVCKKSLSTVSEYKMHVKDHRKFDSVLKKQYRCRKKLKKNLKKSNLVKKFKCDHCDWSFNKSNLLRRHLRTHTGEKPFKCSNCSRFFTQQNSLNRHLLKHNGVRPFVCEFCKMNFSQKGHLINHIKRCHAVTKEATRIHKCTLCPCVYNSLNALNKHLNVHHGLKTKKSNRVVNKNERNNVENDNTNETINLIKDSSKLDKWLEEVAQELQRGDNNTEKLSDNLLLDQCELRLNLIENEQYETIIEQGSSQISNFKTSNCSKTENSTFDRCDYNNSIPMQKQDESTIDYNNVVENQEINNRIDDKTDKSISLDFEDGSNKVSLKKPVYSETVSVSNTKINLLNRTKNLPSPNFKNSGVRGTTRTANKADPKVLYLPNITTNVADIYNNVASKLQPKCQFCGKMFKKNADLERHNRTHTGDKPFKCDQQECNKAFATKSSLEYHTVTHMGKMKRAACPQCNGLFATTSSLKVHMRQHTGEKPFKCPVCGDAFRTTGHLHTHVVIHKRKNKHK